MNMMQLDDESANFDLAEQKQDELFDELEETEAVKETELELEPVVLLPVESPEPAENPPQSTHHKKTLTMNAVVSFFAACPRCCYFLAGYQVAHGRPNLETAVAQSKAGWLTLTWAGTTSELVHKSFGNQIDVDCYHFEGCCPECRRHFIYRAAKGHQGDTFRVELRPHPRH